MQLTKTEYAYILQWAKKLKGVQLLGGNCTACGESHIAVLDFHHVLQKSFSIHFREGLRWSELLPEIKKCKLLCANCHRELHGKLTPKDTRSTKNKDVFLLYKNTVKCEVCGYHKCNSALTLHHNGGKEFDPSQIKTRLNTVQDLDDSLIKELNKCSIICENCHRKTHFDEKRYHRFEREITTRVTSYKELQPKINREKITLLLNQGLSYRQVAKQLGCAKSTIAYAVNKNEIRIEK